jgi:kynureninase
MAALRASLEIFSEATMGALVKKSRKLTGYLSELIAEIPGDHFEVITPEEESSRGCQVSILVEGRGAAVYERLEAADVVCDYREPDVIRIAPMPLYNSFEDVWRFCEILKESVGS